MEVSGDGVGAPRFTCWFILLVINNNYYYYIVQHLAVEVGGDGVGALDAPAAEAGGKVGVAHLRLGIVLLLLMKILMLIIINMNAQGRKPAARSASLTCV